MVIEDIATQDSTHSNGLYSPPPYLDRFFANVIDFLILIPLITLFGSGIATDLRWAIFNQSGGESYFHIFQYAFISFALFLLYETLFIYFNKATPGHRFLYLQLVSETDRPITLFQILFRTLFKFQALVLALIPFAEIVLRPDRSTYYDRLSQTKIVSLRRSRPDDIHPEFKKLIFNWVRTSIILFFIVIGLVFYQTAGKARITTASKLAPGCQDSLAQYLKSYLSKSKETENLNCARTVVEKSFDSKSKNQTFGYLAQLIVSPNEELKESYKKKYCADRPNKPLCRADWKAEFENFKPDEEDIVNLLVQMNEGLGKNDHARIFAILDLLYTHLDWNKNLELYYLTSYLFLNEGGRRAPASQKDGSAFWLESKARFLKRMSIVK